jgi:hypothetical protein
MPSSLVISKMKAILIIDILIVAFAAGAYAYLQNQGVISTGPKPAAFTVTGLVVNPLVAEAGEQVSVSVNVTNVGELEGNYTAKLLINDLLKDNQTVDLTAGESSLIEFLVTENAEGNYTAKIEDLSSSFNVKAAPPVTSSITLATITALPYEVWVGENVTVTTNAHNPSGSEDSLAVKLSINNEVVQTQKITLAPGASTPVMFVYNATAQGIHNVKVNNLASGFIVAPTGKHTIFIVSNPKQGVDLKLNGAAHKTPYSELVDVGVPQTVEVPAADPTGKFTFLKWEDGTTNPTRTITLTARKTVTAYFSGGTSCPSLYMWNGTGYEYVAEVSNHGWLGYMNYVNEDEKGQMLNTVYWRNSPWDYVPLNKDQIQPTNGYYNLTLTQRWDEIFYLDSAQLVVVDHPSNVNVYSTMVEQYIDPNYMGKIYTVSKNPSAPVSAVNQNGENVLSQISKVDGVFTTGLNGKESPSYDNITWNRLTLNLGNLKDAPQVKLVLKAMVDFGDPDSYSKWINMFYSQPRANGSQPTPIPYMEVKDANGNWVRVPENRQFPLAPDGIARTYVVDLTGLFPTNDYSLRISNFWNVTYDYIGVDTTPQQNITIHTIDPQAYFNQAFSTNSLASGNFTKYGNVTQLLLSEDDKFVIGKQGDSVSLQFPTSNLPAPSDGMERDYFFFVACWFKTEYANYGFGPGFGFTVDPLPFQNMSGFPYPLKTENYPFDQEHVSYLSQWNTRPITPAAAEQGILSIQNLQLIILATAITALLAVNLSYGLLKLHKRHGKIQKETMSP